MGFEPEDPAHHGGLADEAEHEAVAELSGGPWNGAKDVEKDAIEGPERAASRWRQFGGSSNPGGDGRLSRRGGALLKERVAHIAVLAFVCLDNVGGQHRNVGEHEGVSERSEQPT